MAHRTVDEPTSCPVCEKPMTLVETKQGSAKHECPTHGCFIVAPYTPQLTITPTEENGREFCRALGIDPTRVMTITVSPLERRLVVQTVDGTMTGRLVPEDDSCGALLECAFLIVKDEQPTEKPGGPR